MNILTLVHLGQSLPPYIRDCIHQLRLWNSVGDLRIYLILDPPCATANKGFWESLATEYSVTIVYTDSLIPTHDHAAFRTHYKGDTEFRNGYWKFVKERFFYMEELMIREGISRMIAMEYDVLLYRSVQELMPLLEEYAGDKITSAMDNEAKAYPIFMYIGSPDSIAAFNNYMLFRVNTTMDDMDILADFYRARPDCVATLPLITLSRNCEVPLRTNDIGDSCESSEFLSNGFDILQSLFDSAVIGQAVAGVDLRNSGGERTVGYENQCALYSFFELNTEWRRDGQLWQPFVDGYPLNTIHMHSKTLSCFLSDRADVPCADYSAEEVHAALLAINAEKPME